MVTITGKGFGNVVSAVNLSFNGTKAVITTLTDTLITAPVPTGAATGKISISLNGHSAASEKNFVILAGTWIRKKDLPFTGIPSEFNGGPGRVYPSAFSIGNKGYAGAGSSPNKDGVGPYLTDWWEYDPSADQWTSKADFPITGGLIVGVSFAINSKGYAGVGQPNCGCAYPFTKEFWEYDPSADHWTRKADFPGAWKKGGIGFGAGDKGYAGLGLSWDSSGGFAQKDWWEYDPIIDSWTRKADFPGLPQSDLTGFVINNKIYLGLGQDNLDRSWWEYDPSNDSWSRKADYPGISMAGTSPGGFTVGNKGYIAGMSECWEYDPATDQWEEQAFFDNYRAAGVAFAIGEKGYFTSGGGSLFSDYSPRNDLWEFTPPQ